MTDVLIQQVTTESLSTSNGDTVVHEIVVTELLSQGIVGPPGPQGPVGPAGAPGSGTSVPWHEDVFTLGGNQTVFVLSTTPAANTVSMYVNGLRQTNDNFVVAGSSVTVTGFTPTTGDRVTFMFQ